MAKITDQEQRHFLERTEAYTSAATAILNHEQETLAAINQEPVNAALKRFALADEMLNLASNYLVLNDVSQTMLKAKSETALADARKSLIKSVAYLEQIVTHFIDAPFSDYQEQLAEIDSVDAAARYLLIRKMGLAIQLLEDAYGDNSKWKWSFVELEGRHAAVAKNIIDLRNVSNNTDYNSPNYEATVHHLRLSKKLIAQTADRYRSKYELSTKQIEDFKLGITFLSSLRRLHIVLGEPDDATLVKKKLDVWAAKLDGDIKKQKEMQERR
ncbi:MAG: hypothetical protein LBH97_07185 [Treponema sp.]|jgi:hypothetical protein|nr:hypothetical protein [Treponema sp.]